MPWPFKQTLEDAPDGDPAYHPSRQALVPTHTLTVELLDWLVASLEAVLKTPQLHELAGRRVEQSLRDALKHSDQLYPHTEEVRRRIALHHAENWPTGVTPEKDPR